jgi:hypothetical protein
LRVRLQKLSEKTVALKWNHNPKNIFIQIAGYNIYINSELCGTMKPDEVSASIDGIQTEGEYKIFIRSFLGNLESPDSNQVITRVKKKPAETDSKTGTSELSSTSESEYDHADTSNSSSIESKSKKESLNSEKKNSPSSQDVSEIMNKSKNDTNESIEKKLNMSNSESLKTANISLENIIVSSLFEDKRLTAATSTNVIPILENNHRTSPKIVSRSPNESSVSPKRDKGLIHHLMKDKSFEQSIIPKHHRPQDVAARIAKNGHSILNEIERKQLLPKGSESSLDSLINVSGEIPFTSHASIASTVSFSIQSAIDKNVNKSFEKLTQQIAPLPQSKLVNVSSPIDEAKNHNKLLVKHTRSNSANKSVSQEIFGEATDNKIDDKTENNSESKAISHSSLLADFVNNVKFSNSEPNLSNNLNKTDSTTVNESLSSVLRRSISIHDETDPDIENNSYHRFSQYDGNYVNYQDMSELN